MAKEKESRFGYKKQSAQAMRERANQKGGNFDSIFKQGVKIFKPREGKNLVRILQPTWDDYKHFGFEIHVNYNVGADKQSYLSLSKMLGKADPLAEARAEAQKEGDDALAKALSPNKRVVYFLIDRMAEEEGPQVWAAPWTFDKDFANICIDEDDGKVTDPADPEDGADFRFYKEGTGRKTEYPASKMKLMKPSPVSDDDDQAEEWVQYVKDNPIPDILNYYSYDHIESVFGGKAGRDEDKEEDEEKSSKRRRSSDDEDEAPRKKRSSSRDEEEDEKPAKKRSSRDEEEEDEKPAKKTSKKEPEEEAEEEEAGLEFDVGDKVQFFHEDDDEWKAGTITKASPEKGYRVEDEDEEVHGWLKPKHVKAAKKASKKPRDEEEEEEEDEKPAKKGSKKPAKDDDDEGEEDEKPKGEKRLSVKERLAARNKRDED